MSATSNEAAVKALIGGLGKGFSKAGKNGVHATGASDRALCPKMRR